MRTRLEPRKLFPLMFSLVFLIVFSIGALYKASARPDLTVHNIDTHLNYATIQEAIDAPETLNGHTVLVDDKTYYEHVTVNKAVRLHGASQKGTIIDGNGTGYVVSLVVSGAEMAGFTVQNGAQGIYLHDAQNASATENRVLNCSYAGIFVHGCSRCRIADNTVTSADMAGIYLWESVEILIENNTITNASHGIYLLVNSTNDIISKNSIHTSPQGIVCSINCNNNAIVANMITGSTVGGISMGGAHNNTIYHNNLFNSIQVFSYEGSSNFWDDGAEGNFWKDYTGSDLDKDGIGDTPYTIDEKNRDNHPLMGVFSDFNITWEEQTYNVDIISNFTVSDFSFSAVHEPDLRKEIDFNVTGENENVGFCRVMIPTRLMSPPYIVLVNGRNVSLSLLSISNSTHAYLYFTFDLSAKHVIIVPELVPSLALPLLMILALPVARFSKTRRDAEAGTNGSQSINMALKTKLPQTCEAKEFTGKEAR
jgi:parallel beta-helix repeat protein